MQYRRLGGSGLQLSALSFGAWVTFGSQIGRSTARELVATAWDHGINFFDNAEGYANGEAERVMGDVIADLRLPRRALGDNVGGHDGVGRFAPLPGGEVGLCGGQGDVHDGRIEHDHQLSESDGCESPPPAGRGRRGRSADGRGSQ